MPTPNQALVMHCFVQMLLICLIVGNAIAYVQIWRYSERSYYDHVRARCVQSMTHHGYLIALLALLSILNGAAAVFWYSHGGTL